MPTCYKHPDRETNLSCGRCGRPLCPDCVRHGATGVRCEDCIRPSPRERGMADPQQVRRALLAAGAVAAVGGLLLGLVGWVQTLPALVLGVLVGSAAFQGSQRHRDPTIQAIAAGMALFGIIVAIVAEAAFSAGGGASHTFGMLVAVSYWEVLWPALAAIIGAIVRLQI